jgi:ectoine hydroxylase-related dioxygenase (phytanoyl-CoA dioxygenase family)
MILKIADILKNLPWSFNSTAELPWLDRSRAEKSLQKARQQRRISEREYQLLDHWRELGYCIVKDLIPATAIDNLVAELADLFFLESAIPGLRIEGIQAENLPASLSHEQVLALDIEQRKALVNSIWRLHAFHEISPAARAIFDNQNLRDLVNLIIGKSCEPRYSINFLHGTEQGLHEDMAVFYVHPANHLVGVWIALEDISADAGPLIFYPKSHKNIKVTDFFPDYPAVNLKNITAAQIPQYQDYVNQRAHNYDCQSFTAKKGEILLWHGMLIHGGGKINNTLLTRKSMVIHFIAEGGDYNDRALGPFNW